MVSAVRSNELGKCVVLRGWDYPVRVFAHFSPKMIALGVWVG